MGGDKKSYHNARWQMIVMRVMQPRGQKTVSKLPIEVAPQLSWLLAPITYRGLTYSLGVQLMIRRLVNGCTTLPLLFLW